MLSFNSQHRSTPERWNCRSFSNGSVKKSRNFLVLATKWSFDSFKIPSNQTGYVRQTAHVLETEPGISSCACFILFCSSQMASRCRKILPASWRKMRRPLWESFGNFYSVPRVRKQRYRPSFWKLRC